MEANLVIFFGMLQIITWESCIKHVWGKARANKKRLGILSSIHDMSFCQQFIYNRITSIHLLLSLGGETSKAFICHDNNFLLFQNMSFRMRCWCWRHPKSAVNQWLPLCSCCSRGWQMCKKWLITAEKSKIRLIILASPIIGVIIATQQAKPRGVKGGLMTLIASVNVFVPPHIAPTTLWQKSFFFFTGFQKRDWTEQSKREDRKICSS